MYYSIVLTNLALTVAKFSLLLTNCRLMKLMISTLGLYLRSSS